jgi:hypothetical protein
MSTQTASVESQQLKDGLRTTWMAGDFGQIAQQTRLKACPLSAAGDPSRTIPGKPIEDGSIPLTHRTLATSSLRRSR